MCAGGGYTPFFDRAVSYLGLYSTPQTNITRPKLSGELNFSKGVHSQDAMLWHAQCGSLHRLSPAIGQWSDAAGVQALPNDGGASRRCGDVPPYNGTIVDEGRDAMTVTKREQPKLLLGEKWQPLAGRAHLPSHVGGHDCGCSESFAPLAPVDATLLEQAPRVSHPFRMVVAPSDVYGNKINVPSIEGWPLRTARGTSTNIQFARPQDQRGRRRARDSPAAGGTRIAACVRSCVGKACTRTARSSISDPLASGGGGWGVLGPSSDGYSATERPRVTGDRPRMSRCTAAPFMFISLLFNEASSAYSPRRPRSEVCTVLAAASPGGTWEGGVGEGKGGVKGGES